MVRRQPDKLEQLDHRAACRGPRSMRCTMSPRRPGLHRHPRVERGVRVLEDHLASCPQRPSSRPRALVTSWPSSSTLPESGRQGGHRARVATSLSPTRHQAEHLARPIVNYSSTLSRAAPGRTHQVRDAQQGFAHADSVSFCFSPGSSGCPRRRAGVDSAADTPPGTRLRRHGAVRRPGSGGLVSRHGGQPECWDRRRCGYRPSRRGYTVRGTVVDVVRRAGSHPPWRSTTTLSGSPPRCPVSW